MIDFSHQVKHHILCDFSFSNVRLLNLVTVEAQVMINKAVLVLDSSNLSSLRNERSVWSLDLVITNIETEFELFLADLIIHMCLSGCWLSWVTDLLPQHLLFNILARLVLPNVVCWTYLFLNLGLKIFSSDLLDHIFESW